MIDFVKNTDDSEWNSIIDSERHNQLITIGHNPSLASILEKVFGYKSENYLIKNEGRTIGVFPAVRFKGKLISMPHFSYGGPLFISSYDKSQDIREVLKNEKYEIRSFSKLSEYNHDKKVTAVIELKDSADEQIMELKSSFRRKIRQAIKKNFKVKRGGVELLTDFYSVYSRKMLQKGSPPLGKTFFNHLLREYSYGKAIITALYDEGKVIAAAFTLSYMGFNEICWVSTNHLYDKFNVNSLLYWTIIEDSIADGCKYFSMGRSTKNSSNHLYKKRWKPLEFDIYYNYSEPLKNDLKEFTFLTKLWKFQPLLSSQLLGHRVSKYVY